MKTRKWLSILAYALIIPLAFFSCEKNQEQQAQPDNTIEKIKLNKDDLNGHNFVFGNWRADWDAAVIEPKNDRETWQIEWRNRIQEELGITIREVKIADWNKYLQTVIELITQYPDMEDRQSNFYAYYVTAGWAMELYKQGLLAPLPQSITRISGQRAVGEQSNPDWGRPAYDSMIAELFTFNGNQYAFAFSDGNSSSSSIVMLYNKQILRDAGIDPDLPYDLQASGEWTWDAFYDILKTVTSGNIYGTVSDNDGDVLNSFVYSNNANHVIMNSDGTISASTDTSEYAEALEFYVKLMDERLMMREPAGAGWGWHFNAFTQGKATFFIGQEWFSRMAFYLMDDFGMVVPPKGPSSDDYRVSVVDNVIVIPAVFTPKEASAILYALDRWMVPVDTDWQSAHYDFYKDRRAVDETLALIKNPRGRYRTYTNYMLIPGFDETYKNFIADLNRSPADYSQLVDSYSERYNAVISNFNR